MSLRNQAAADFKANLEADGDSIVLTDSEGTDYSVTGSVRRTDTQIAPGTNEVIYDPRTSVTVALSALDSEPDEDWTVSVTDVTGTTISGQVANPKYDRYLGYVRFNIEAVEA